MSSKKHSKNKKDGKREATSNYEPVFVNVDGFYALSRPNLTGLPRQRKDKVADFANVVTKWESANVAGAQLLAKIANAKLDHIFNAEASSEIEIPDSLEKDVAAFEKVIDELDDVAEKINCLTSEFQALKELDRIQRSELQDSTSITADVDSQLSEIMKRINVEFKEEIRLKRSIYENVAHVKTRHQMMVYSSAWMHQPYLDECNLNFQLRFMLKISGHG